MVYNRDIVIVCVYRIIYRLKKFGGEPARKRDVFLVGFSFLKKSLTYRFMKWVESLTRK